MNNKLLLQTVLLLSSVVIASHAIAAESDNDSGGPLIIQIGETRNQNAALWLESSLKRVFPYSPPTSTNLALLTARNGKIAFQACVRNNGISALNVDCSVTQVDDLTAQVRSVGFVPLKHFTVNTATNELDGLGYLPGLVPDPLYPDSELEIGPQESRSFWITLNIPADAQPGVRQLEVRFSIDHGRQTAKLPVQLEISRLVIQSRHDFPVTHWWRGEANWDYYKTGMFDERWWQITKYQMQDLLAHGSDVAFVPNFFDRREVFKHPCQMLIVDEPKPGTYTFDWTRVKEFTDMCKQIGFRRFEWSHLWMYGGVKNPMRVYKKVGENYILLWPPESSGFSDTYINFLKQFLPSFHEFLLQEGLLENSYFHLSDEPGGGQAIDNYKRAREILRELAPWMKVMDALSDIEYGKQRLTDMPVVLIGADQEYRDANIPHWVYFCCGPEGPYLNRFLDTPLPKIRMAGWLFYHLRSKGFLHWGYNYWDYMNSEKADDPVHDASAGAWPDIPFGDPFVVYPGSDGKPMDSVRWEVFAESLQDYAILQTAGIDQDDKMFSPIHSFADFPKSEQWINNTLEKVLKMPPAQNTSAK